MTVMINKSLFFLILNLSFIGAQINGKSIALLDFNGNGINKMESIALTNIFNDELNKTGAVFLVDRNIVKDDLSNQGIEQIKCKNLECISKAGASLNVELIIDGLIKKNKDSFSLEINVYKVSDAMKPLIVTSLVDGKVVVRKKIKEPKLIAMETKNINYKGTADGFIVEIKEMAWALVSLKRPEELVDKNQEIVTAEIIKDIDRYGAVMRSTLLPGLGQMYFGESTWGWVWLGAESIIGALALSEYNSYKSALKNYNEYQNEYLLSNDPKTIDLLRIKSQDSRKKMISADEQMTSFLYALGGIWMANIIHASVVKPKKTSQAYSKSSFNFVYNNILKQPQIQLSIKLD